MNALKPLAREFVDQTVQSATLDQRHRAQIWARIQERVVAESSTESSRRSSEASVARLASKRRIVWAGFAAASCAVLASALGTAHRFDHAAEEPRQGVHSPAPRESRETSLAPIALADASAQAPLPAADLGCKQAPQSGPQPPQPPRLSQSAPNQVATLSPRHHRAPAPHGNGTTAQVHPQRTATARKDASRAYDGQHQSYKHDDHSRRQWAEVTYARDNGRARQVRSDDLTKAAFRRSGAQFGASPGWLELAPHTARGISPLGENWFESSLPLKLTQPQLRLEAVSFE